MSSPPKNQPSLTEKAIRHFLNQKIRPYGSVSELRLSRQEKQLTLQLNLKGEAEEVQLILSPYRLTSKANSPTTLCVEHIRCSKPWLELLCNHYLTNKEIELPKALSPLLKALL